MKTLAYIFVIIFTFIALNGCKDIIEEDIRKDKVIIKAPSDNLVSKVYSQQFWWETLDGASQYRLEIVSPRFDSVVSIVLDTITKSTKFTKTLIPGSYQWRIRAENGSYESEFQTYNLKIEASSLTLQSVTRTAPLNDVYQKNNFMEFNWNEVYGATSYEIEIYSVVNNTSTVVKTDEIEFVELPYQYSFSTEGDYKWRVRAKNSTEQTPWTSYWYTGYYTSTPSAPTLDAPADNSNQSSSVVFSWNTVSKAKTYTLYLYDGLESAAPTKYEGITGSSYLFTFPSSASRTQYWSVSCTDKAGNISPQSSKRKLTLQ